MKLHTPFIISSRLWPALRIGQATLSLRLPLSPVFQGRVAATMIFDAPGIQFTDQSLRSGCQGFRSLVHPFASYLSFLEAAAEVREGSDNADMFPRSIMQWARENSDAIAEVRASICDDNGDARHDLIVVSS